jgi:hypothetical protein
MKNFQLILICWACWMALYTSVSLGWSHFRSSLHIIWIMRKYHPTARDLFYFGVIFIVIMVPMQAVMTAQALTSFFPLWSVR